MTLSEREYETNVYFQTQAMRCTSDPTASPRSSLSYFLLPQSRAILNTLSPTTYHKNPVILIAASAPLMMRIATKKLCCTFAPNLEIVIARIAFESNQAMRNLVRNVLFKSSGDRIETSGDSSKGAIARMTVDLKLRSISIDTLASAG